jgi:L,D-peptidoglycan transpeptidase YkuD (ErfK/YbiS/YcfS/YnhG family)
MMGIFGDDAMAWPRRFVAALLVVLALAGCSEEPAGEVERGPAGKTPVVRPEDVHGSGRAAAVLAPDYRQDMKPGVTDPPAAAKAPAEPAGRLFAAKPGQPPAAPSATGSPPAVPSQLPAGPATTAQPPAAPASPAQPPAFAPAMPGQPSPAVVAAAAAPAAQPPTASLPAGQTPQPGANQRPSTGFPVEDARQLVLVSAADAQADKGTLRRFSRTGPGAPWTPAGQPVPCRLGRKGLGQGRGLAAALPGGPAKREGDGRTPAGVFPIPAAFGYASAEDAAKAGVRLPYVAVNDRTSCVTDAGSPLFGRVAGPAERPGGGVRQDRMVRDDGANAWGVVIGHNVGAADPQAGTCLFLNVRPAGGPATGGSVGIPAEAAAALAAWLDPAARPVVAIVPEAEVGTLGPSWGLP